MSVLIFLSPGLDEFCVALQPTLEEGDLNFQTVFFVVVVVCF